jgi:hypothetical protein
MAGRAFVFIDDEALHSQVLVVLVSATRGAPDCTGAISHYPIILHVQKLGSRGQLLSLIGRARFGRPKMAGVRD